MAKEKQEETFRVIDRRLFNESGELRQEAVEQEQRDEAAAAAKATAAAAAPASNKEDPAPIKPAAPAEPATPAAPAAAEPIPSSRAFQMLVDLLYSNAAVYLGGYADPATGRPMLDLEGARNIIDMFEALREKTRGNLAPEDDRILVEVLGSLKMAFLEVSKAASQAMRENPTAIPTSKLRGKP